MAISRFQRREKVRSCNTMGNFVASGVVYFQCLTLPPFFGPKVYSVQMIRGPRREDSASIRSLKALLSELGLTAEEAQSFLTRLATDVADAQRDARTIDILCERFADTLSDAQTRFGGKSHLASKMKFVAGSLLLGVAGNLLTDLIKAGFARTYSLKGLREVRQELHISVIEAAQECEVNLPTYQKAERGEAIPERREIKSAQVFRN